MSGTWYNAFKPGKSAELIWRNQMTNYVATFTDGSTLTRTSERVYTVAWRASWDNGKGSRGCASGFAISREKAVVLKPRALLWPGMSFARRAAEKAEIAEIIANHYRVEFADAKVQQ
jgi:hypothetical protein